MSGPAVWITGARGLIGSHLVQTATTIVPAWRPIPLTRDAIELTDFNSVEQAIVKDRPSAIIHCAALSRTETCECQPQKARLNNVTVTQHLAALAENIPFLFLSTDLVFDGRSGNYRETDPVNPLSVYARTKVEAEQIVLQNSRHTVIRLALNSGVSPAGDRSFTEQMRLRWQRGETIKLFTDEFRSPLPAAVTAHAIWELLQEKRSGLYHLGGSERLSRWQIGQLIARRWPHLETRMEPGSARDFVGPPRALDTSLDCSKVQRHLSFRLPGLTEWMRNNPEAPV